MKFTPCDYCVIIFLALLVSCSPAHADPYNDYRFCGEPKRNADGVIIRDAKVPREFQKLHPCPSTGLKSGACPGWAKDHVIPLASCGCDSVDNMQWLSLTIKSCAGTECKDRWERRVYTCEQGAK